MADIRLDLSLRQEQKLSTQMVQTMETIAMPAQELNEKIRKEAETNPVMILHDKDASYDSLSQRYRSATDRSDSYSDSEPYDSDEERPNWIEGMVGEKEDLKKHLDASLAEANQELPNYARIKSIEIMPEDFERTPKRSIKRYLYQRNS